MAQVNRQHAHDFVQYLRKHPEQYTALRDRLTAAKTEDERVQILLDFATSDHELAKLSPTSGGPETQLMWTTVTVTTIFVPSSAY